MIPPTRGPLNAIATATPSTLAACSKRALVAARRLPASDPSNLPAIERVSWAVSTPARSRCWARWGLRAPPEPSATQHHCMAARALARSGGQRAPAAWQGGSATLWPAQVTAVAAAAARPPPAQQPPPPPPGWRRREEHQEEQARPLVQQRTLLMLRRRQQEQQQQQQQQQLTPQPPPAAATGRRPASSRTAGLAAALQLAPAQAAAMMRDWPTLANFNHDFLADKLAEMAALLGLEPAQLSGALAARPKVLGVSLGAFEARVRTLRHLLGPTELVAQLVLREPALLSWSPAQLEARLQRMAASLGVHPEALLQLLRRHPQLLPASSHWSRTLQLLQQLLQLAAGPAGGAAAATAPAPRGLLQQQQQQEEELLLRAARAFGLANPQLLLVPPEQLMSRMASMQARSALPAAVVAAAAVANPELLLAFDEGGRTGVGARGRRRERMRPEQGTRCSGGGGGGGGGSARA